jgi:hypothetical protein
MSEENPYGSHQVAVQNTYPLHLSQSAGNILQSNSSPVVPVNPSYIRRNPSIGTFSGGNNFSMNGVAQHNHPQQPFTYQHAIASTPRGPSPNVAAPSWAPTFFAGSSVISAPSNDPTHRNPTNDTSQSNTPYPSQGQGDQWDKSRPSFVRPQFQDQMFAQPPKAGGAHYNLHQHQHYSRPPHPPIEPGAAAPSPPTQYPSSPRAPLSVHPNTNGVSRSQQTFRQSNYPQVTLISPDSTLESLDRRIEPILNSHANGFTDSSQTATTTHHPVQQQHTGRAHNLRLTTDHTENGARNPDGSFIPSQRNGDGCCRQLPDRNAQGLNHPGSGIKASRSSDYDSADDERLVKRESNSQTPTVNMSPIGTRGEGLKEQSPSFPGKECKIGILDNQTKKRGAAVFRDNGIDYYENEKVPAGVKAPTGWQIGTGKQTKGLLLPVTKDGIPVNPEWGFTAGGKARQRLPQACKNCRAKKIRCV